MKLYDFQFLVYLCTLGSSLVLNTNEKKDGIFLSQTKYLKKILKKYGMEDSKPVCTPMVTGCAVSAQMMNQQQYINQLTDP